MKTFGITNTGLVRSLNEDNYFVSEKPVGKLPNLFIVTDGMGGHNAGEIASKLAIDEFVEYCKRTDIELVEKMLVKGIEHANKVIYNKAKKDTNLFGMGTTFVACTVIDPYIYIANIGDSRLYVFRDELKQITIDHSYVEELIRAGEITRAEGYNHPDRNKITRAIGTNEEIEVDLFKLNIKDISKILMCSDGLTNMLLDEHIVEIISNYDDLSKQGTTLIEKSLEKGGLDNITLIIIDLGSEV